MVWSLCNKKCTKNLKQDNVIFSQLKYKSQQFFFSCVLLRDWVSPCLILDWYVTITVSHSEILILFWVCNFDGGWFLIRLRVACAASFHNLWKCVTLPYLYQQHNIEFNLNLSSFQSFPRKLCFRRHYWNEIGGIWIFFNIPWHVSSLSMKLKIILAISQFLYQYQRDMHLAFTTEKMSTSNMQVLNIPF